MSAAHSDTSDTRRKTFGGAAHWLSLVPVCNCYCTHPRLVQSVFKVHISFDGGLAIGCWPRQLAAPSLAAALMVEQRCASTHNTELVTQVQSSLSNLLCFDVVTELCSIYCGYITVLPLQARRLSADGGHVCSGRASAQCLRSCTQPARDAPPPAPHRASAASGASTAGCEPVPAAEAIPCQVVSILTVAGPQLAPPVPTGRRPQQQFRCSLRYSRGTALLHPHWHSRRCSSVRGGCVARHHRPPELPEMTTQAHATPRSRRVRSARRHRWLVDLISSIRRHQTAAGPTAPVGRPSSCPGPRLRPPCRLCSFLGPAPSRRTCSDIEIPREHSKSTRDLALPL